MDTEAGIQLDAEQRQAVELCCDVTQRRLAAVTGQAGTGKTTILRQAHETLAAAGYDIALAAPTGKASKRIKEATGIEAMTIHRLLEYPYPGERDPKTGKVLNPSVPKRDRFNPLDQQVVFVDEAAMVNHEVYRNLVDAMRRGGALRFFGDVNQLPPIEQNKRLADEPSPFENVLNKFPSVKLSVIYRQGEGSGIVINGDRILRGRMPARTADFTYHVSDQPVSATLDWIMEMRDEGIDFSSINHQIICPTKKGWVGTLRLNNSLQNLFQDEKTGEAIQLPRHEWEKDNICKVMVGDKVIWTQNNYTLEIFNGETGVVTEVSELGEVTVDFGDRIVIIPPLLETINRRGDVVNFDPRRDLDLAYSITTHKAQGSEYQWVAYVMNSSRPWGLNRNNFYTGITRARTRVHVITDQKSLQYSMRSARR